MAKTIQPYFQGYTVKYISQILFASMIFTGCATSSPEAIYLKNGQYAESYYFISAYGESISPKNRAGIIQEILSKTNGAQGTIFKNQILGKIQSQPKDLDSYKSHKLVIEMASSDGLLSHDQKNEINNELLQSLEKDSITNSKLRDESLRSLYPQMGAYRLQIAKSQINDLEKGNADLSEYIPFYKFFAENNDLENSERIRKTMRSKIAETLNSNTSSINSYKNLESTLRYIEITDDRDFDKKIKEILAKTPMTRSQLTLGPVSALYPTFSKDQVITRATRLSLTSSKDDYIIQEIGDAIKRKNEWVIIDENGQNLNFSRMRFQESRTGPINQTQTVSNPNFTTLLFIPKNASVLFDYTTTEYAINWGMHVQDQKSNKAKSISGQRTAKKIECSNLRYQNVFGGTGSLSSMPNEETAAFCTSSANVNFDKIRSEAIDSIASEINNHFLKSN